ncbi:MAG: hypothetical protein V7735_09050 [Photobacterium frigidiphilum]|uniref:hypothetical protein n=1 Tax=Photobacterium frigidiphilum TaxID=264736 RepID=UPI0030021935
MKKILFVVRGYKPDISASGNLINPLIEELKKKHDVYILTSTAREVDLNHIERNIFRIHINDKINSIGRYVNFIKRNFSSLFYNAKIKEVFKHEIERLDSLYSFDAIIAITFEEALSLIDSDIDKSKKNLFLLEKIPSSSRITFIKNYQTRIARVKIKEMINSVTNCFLLPIVFNGLKNKNQLKGNVFQLEHPMVVDRVIDNKFSIEENVSFLYAGGIDRYQRNPCKVIEFMAGLPQYIPYTADFFVYGNCIEDVKAVATKNINIHHAISPEQLDNEYKNSNCLITIGNRENDIFPSKIFDCISTGLPIIHFSQSKHDPYYSYLKNYKHSLILPIDSLSDINNYTKVVEFLSYVSNNRIDYTRIYNLFFECTPEYNAKSLESVLFK